MAAASPSEVPATGAGGPMIELRAVTKRFGAFTAVENVSLQIQRAEFLTLLGPSGCGKTTLLRMLAGFETPTEGRVLLEGKDVTHLPPYRRDVNQVFQSYAIFPHLSVEENIAFGLKMRNVPAAERATRVREATALVALDGLEKRRPHELSGGQRQRVALARALICRPKVLLLDEPLSALDAKLRRTMQLELKQLQQRLGMTFVFVTHDQEEALTMSDRIAIVNKGRIEQLAGATEIYHAPATAFAAGFVGEANLLPGEVVAREAATGNATVRLAGGVELSVASAAIGAAAKRVLLSVRPEKICLERAPLARANTFSAVIRVEVFRGAFDEFVLAAPGGLELRALAANESAHQESWHPGDTVHCTIHTDDIVVVEQQ